MFRGIRRWLAGFVLFVFVLTGAYIGYVYWYTHRYDALIEQISAKYGLDAKLVRAVVREESNFNPTAISTAGALGLMQVTSIVVTEWEQTAEQSNGTKSFTRYWAKKVPDMPYPQAVKLSPEQLLLVPEVNLNVGCWYLDRLRQRFATEPQPLAMALAGYNAGPSQAARWRDSARTGSRLTEETYIRQIDYPETQGYVRRILANYRNRRAIF